MATYTIPRDQQYTVEGKDYFRFPHDTRGTRIFWTDVPKDLKKCPRTQLNRLVRLFEKLGLVVLPTTLRNIKKADVLDLINPLILFEYQ